MAQPTTAPQMGAGQEAKGDAVQASAPQLATQAPFRPGASPQDDIVREKLTQVLGDILTKAQEVGFELATLECPNAHACPLVRKSRELITALKKLFEMRKELERK